MAFNVEYIYTVIDKFSRPLERLRKSTQKFTSANRMAHVAVGRLSKRMGKFADKMSVLQSAMGALMGGMALKGIIEKTMEFDDALRDVGRFMEFEEKNGLKKYGKRMQNLGIDLGKSAVGLLQITVAGAKMKITNDEMERFVILVAKVANAFDMSDEAAGIAIGSIKTKLTLSLDGIETLMNRVNFLADTTTAQGERMIDILARTGGTMSSLGFTDKPEFIAGFVAFADQVSVTSELAASGINQMFSKMRRNPKLIKELMSDPMKALVGELERFKKIPAELRGQALIKQYGERSARFMMDSIEKIHLLRQAIDAAASAEALTSIEREFAQRAKRLSTTLIRFGEAWNKIVVNMGLAIAPIIKTITPLLTKISSLLGDFVDKHPLLSQIVLGFVSLATILGVVAVVAVIAAAAIAPILAMLAPFALIIGLVSLGVLALAFAFSEWFKSSNPIIDTIRSISSETSILVKSLFELFDSDYEGMASFEFMLKGIGIALSNLLNPVRVFLIFVNKIVEALVAIRNFKLGGSFGKEWFADFGEKIFNAKTEETRTNKDTAANAARKSENKIGVELSGSANIDLTGAGTLTSNTIGLSQGANL